MSHEYQQVPFNNFFLDLVPPSEKVPEYWIKAKHLADLCNEMDTDPDSISIFDPRVEHIRQTVLTCAASPSYNNILARRVNDYLQPDGTTNFNSMLENMGIQINQGHAGVFSKESAKKIELRELLIYGPGTIDNLRKSGQVDLLRQEMADQNALSAGFTWHYGQRFDDPANLDMFLPTNEAKNHWYERRRKMRIYTVFPKEISDFWQDPPVFEQPELFNYPIPAMETVAEKLSYAIIS